VSRFGSEHRGRRLLFVALCAASACELDTVAVQQTAPGVVVHGVLNPNAASQVVLVERTLTGAVNVPDTSFDSGDPILSAGGIPILGATVELMDSTGRVTRAVEDRVVSTDGRGSGVYRFPLMGTSLVLGAKYELHIRTPDGQDVTGSTRIPRPIIRVSGGLSRTLNRDHDALVTQWEGVPGARTYAVRVESPFGPFFLFTDSTSIRLSGDLRNIFAGDFQRVFLPGFRQDIIVAAVDSNFYDYYRTNNDPFTGSGIINRLSGGLGFFGSIVTLNSGTLTITADQTEPIEGRFRLVGTADQNTPTVLTLYVESKGARDDLPSSLTGRYTLGTSNTRGDGIIGKLSGTNVSLAFLANQLSGDTVDVFVGEIDGDTLRGMYTRQTGATGETKFVRLP
jgi:Domain of unknown function (DUF4249)